MATNETRLPPENQLTPEQEALIEHLFTHHPPSDAGRVGLIRIRVVAKIMARVILQECPNSPDRSVAIRHLRDAVMNANASIVLKGLS